MKTQLRIALIGDFNSQVTAHRAIPLALAQAASHLNIQVEPCWVGTETLSDSADLLGFDAIWCVPASPYKNDAGAYLAIRYARENDIPFLGTCGGFQYALVDYARHVLGWEDAGHAETDQQGRLVITPLVCALIEKSNQIHFRPESQIAKAYGMLSVEESYHCSYGVNAAFGEELANSDMVVSGWDDNGDVRSVELPQNRFFIATLFQLERAALREELAPVVVALLEAARSTT